MSFAHVHAAGYAYCAANAPGASLAGIADEDEARGRKAATSRGVRYFESFEALASSPDIDAVIIASDNKGHMPLTILAARHGKHVLCEKPLARTLDEARAMIDATAKAGVILGTAFPCRFIPAMRRIKEMLASGRMGRIRAMRTTNQGTNPGGWFVDPDRAGGGAVMDHTVHVADLMRWFLGSEVAEVYAEADTRFGDIPADDTGMLSMRFANGCIATLDPSWSRPPKSYPTWGNVTMKFVLENGTVEVDAFNQKYEVYSEANGKGYWSYFGDNMDLALVENFAAAVEGRARVSASGHDGMKALEVALAAYESAKRKAPVALPL